MTGAELLAAASAAIAGRWAWHCFFHPFTQCRTCGGKKTNPGSTGKRYGLCRKCKGSGQRQVLGSRQVHKAVRSVVAARSKRKSDR